MIRSEQRLKDVPMFARDEIARIFTLRYRWTDHKAVFQVRWGGTLAGVFTETAGLPMTRRERCLLNPCSESQWSITFLQRASFDCSLCIHAFWLSPGDVESSSVCLPCRNEKQMFTRRDSKMSLFQSIMKRRSSEISSRLHEEKTSLVGWRLSGLKREIRSRILLDTSVWGSMQSVQRIQG